MRSQTTLLEKARARAEKAGVADRCRFVTPADQPADVVTSFDAFEHFDQPEKILLAMHALLKPGGKLIASFGPTWYHPLGGHLVSVFPWAPLVFTEAALIAWRADFKDDGATKLSEVAGGFNQMTIARFERDGPRKSFLRLNCSRKCRSEGCSGAAFQTKPGMDDRDCARALAKSIDAERCFPGIYFFRFLYRRQHDATAVKRRRHYRNCWNAGWKETHLAGLDGLRAARSPRSWSFSIISGFHSFPAHCRRPDVFRAEWISHHLATFSVKTTTSGWFPFANSTRAGRYAFSPRSIVTSSCSYAVILIHDITPGL